MCGCSGVREGGGVVLDCGREKAEVGARCVTSDDVEREGTRRGRLHDDDGFPGYCLRSFSAWRPATRHVPSAMQCCVCTQYVRRQLRCDRLRRRHLLCALLCRDIIRRKPRASSFARARDRPSQGKLCYLTPASVSIRPHTPAHARPNYSLALDLDLKLWSWAWVVSVFNRSCLWIVTKRRSSRTCPLTTWLRHRVLDSMRGPHNLVGLHARSVRCCLQALPCHGCEPTALLQACLLKRLCFTGAHIPMRLSRICGLCICPNCSASTHDHDPTAPSVED